jgi:hypothetical protein
VVVREHMCCMWTVKRGQWIREKEGERKERERQREREHVGRELQFRLYN